MLVQRRRTVKWNTTWSLAVTRIVNQLGFDSIRLSTTRVSTLVWCNCKFCVFFSKNFSKILLIRPTLVMKCVSNAVLIDEWICHFAHVALEKLQPFNTAKLSHVFQLAIDNISISTKIQNKKIWLVVCFSLFIILILTSKTVSIVLQLQFGQ